WAYVGAQRAWALEDADRLAGPGPADLQVCGELTFRREEIADGEGAVHDLFLDRGDDQLVGAGPCDRPPGDVLPRRLRGPLPRRGGSRALDHRPVLAQRPAPSAPGRRVASTAGTLRGAPAAGAACRRQSRRRTLPVWSDHRIVDQFEVGTTTTERAHGAAPDPPPRRDPRADDVQADRPRRQAPPPLLGADHRG